ncbi:DeoR/GlpR family DNA-binding transcription regulator [Succinivibrio dextrinosolvens]|jgi:DeoR/GlpR family transcriptional regulator of sugar metabolism|uniref:Transcriptional regulator, DeoR family n=1 Tax=Succinivibrio dextrinosolvens DSM 3072 TaxID=1123324 RepID=A0A1T4V0C0_9GAMM|nr:DeoR/GlpR family DNA-binding transcription regulator [Succinivibrio dextrinosolvens]MBE6422227.1 DeoR/GlpR transcriptional regulator [Succinivibrio dextrinosolvens]SKA58409.1 transcriptional regulator, DeoR family [Succinivibrio dextrinosolvens DSM 3072]
MTQDRLQSILDYLKNHNLATVDDLVKVTGASAATIRRDLIKLNNDGTVYRVHGSVTLNNSVRQPTTSEKVGQHHEAKIRIANEAVKLVNSGNSLILDAGTTTIELARKLNNIPLKVITSDLNIGMLLSDNQNVSVVITGGELDSSSQSCIGEIARNVLSRLHPDYAFISCNAWDIKYGITAPTSDKANFKHDLIESGACTVLLADSSKYGKSQLFSVADIRDIDVIITDNNLPESVAEQIRSLGIKLILA